MGGRKRSSFNGAEHFVVEGWGSVPADAVSNQWDQPGLGVLRKLFVFHANALNRLTGADAPPNLDYSVEPATHPIQKAYSNGALERIFDRLSHEAFGLRTIVDRYGGSVVPLRVGPQRPDFQHVDGAPTDAFLESLRAMARLEDQGDGVKSYMGLLLHLYAGNHTITLVDEPEAFLHPPQARMLGRLLARRSADADQQVVIATHSVDILQGILSAGTPATIVRLTREENVNHVSVLHNEQLERLWRDPLLKHSNILDGLFHDAVVLCEADSDCRLYSAVLESVQHEDSLRLERETEAADGKDNAPGTIRASEPQILFAHTGGKARLPVVVRALVAVAVPTLVVADFDLLRDKNDVKRVLHAFHADFAELESDIAILDAAVRSDEKPLGRIALREAVVKAIDEGPDILDRNSINALKGLLRVDSGWERVKKTGISAVPQGDAYKSCENLLAALDRKNVFVVPVGYLERFIPKVGGHGPGWVSEVLAQNLHEDESMTDLRDFVRRIRGRAGRHLA